MRPLPEALAYVRNNDDKLGAGLFGAAYVHPDDPTLVIKVSRDPYDPWRGYIKACMSLRSKYAPQVYDYAEVGDMVAVTMERLNHITNNEWHEVFNCNKWGIGGVRNKDMRTFLYKAKEAVEDEGYSTGFDLHDLNIMKRDDGSFVVTDPFF